MSASRNKKIKSRIGIDCPHCGAATITRSSRPMSRVCRQANLACTNEECGATYRAYVEVTHIISPPANPDPGIRLTVSPPRKRAANDEMPPMRETPGGVEVPPANDDDIVTAITG